MNNKNLLGGKNERIYKNKLEYNSSEEEEDVSDSYQSALMSSLLAISNNKKETPSEKKKPTETRIEFVKNILDGNNLRPMIDFDSCDTEAINTRLNKKIMDAKKLFTSMNVKLCYLRSGTTGHTFKAVSTLDKNVAFAVKVCAYPKDDYGAINNLARPENTELRILKVLSSFVLKRRTPHFVLPIGTFNTSITNFIKIPANVIDLNDEKNDAYKTFIKKYHEDCFEEFVSVLISEWCNGGDLLEYIRKNYMTMTLKHWIVIIFQILFTLARVHQKYPAFRHNDMKANNILVEITGIGGSHSVSNINHNESHSTNLGSKNKNVTNSMYCYSIDDFKFLVPNINLQIKIWDFDFACIDGVIENNKVNSVWTKKINITKKENKYYDMHYFFNTLICKRFFPQFYEGGAPQEIVDFVHRMVPEKYRNGSKAVNKKGRIQVDTEYLTPYRVIIEDPLFEKYRFKNYD